MTYLEGLSHVGIQVADLDRSVSFYRDLLGLELVARWEGRDEPYIQELVGYPHVVLDVAVFRLPNSIDAFLEILEYRNVEKKAIDPATANPGTAHVALYVSDLTRLFDRLMNAGVEAVSAVKTPTAGPNVGGKVVYVLDPDGIRLELMETAVTLTGESRPQLPGNSPGKP